MESIEPAVLNVIGQGRSEGQVFFLPSTTLDRKLYLTVNEVLGRIGGKWNRKEKGHVFDAPVAELIEGLLFSGMMPDSKKKYGFFPTPPELARYVVERAGIQPGMKILEPSAGIGNLAEEIIQHTNRLHCVELLEENAKILRGKGFKTAQGDFLSINLKATYDRVIMNPPFERQADIDHVTHAWEVLKPGGRLISIMSVGVTFRENSKSRGFRGFVEEHGSIEALPEAAFKQSGTMVRTCLVFLTKEE